MNVSAGKVGYLDAAVPVEEDVGRFEIAVYDTVIMKVVKSRCLHSIEGEPVGGERKGQGTVEERRESTYNLGNPRFREIVPNGVGHLGTFASEYVCQVAAHYRLWHKTK